MDKRFLTAFVAPPTVEVVGFVLKAYCVRQLLVLHAIESPYVLNNRPIDVLDTLRFLRVCSAKKASILSIKQGFLDTLFVAKMHINKEYHAKIIAFLSAYIKEYSSPPRTVRLSKRQTQQVVVNNDLSKVPEVLMLLTFAMSKLGMSEDEALDTPVGRIVWYGTAYAISEGAEIKLITTDAEERAEDDAESIVEHERLMKERLEAAMAAGKVKQSKVRATSTT